MYRGSIVAIALLSLSSVCASASCLSRREARAQYGGAHLYWHGEGHCWDDRAGHRRHRAERRHHRHREKEEKPVARESVPLPTARPEARTESVTHSVTPAIVYNPETHDMREGAGLVSEAVRQFGLGVLSRAMREDAP
jgi:hypothetical protein